MRVSAIVQARLGSTRLPRKVLLDLGGRPTVDWVVERVAAAGTVDEVVVAIPDLEEDDVLASYLEDRGWTVVRGSAEDVLDRFAAAVEQTEADVLVRVTADCPFTDPQTLDRVIAAFHEPPAVDYCTNVLVRTYPIGLDCEVLSRAVLFEAAAEAREQREREHVTPFIYQRPQRFRLRNVEAPEWARHPEYRLTLDEEADLELLRRVVAILAPPEPAALDIREVLRLLEENRDLAELNSRVRHRHMAKPQDW